MNKTIEYIGLKFNRLTIIADLGRATGRRFVVCKCTCGTEKTIGWDALKSGATQSCGCLQKEIIKKRATKHGLYKHKLYSVWGNIIDRCYKPKNQAYRNYGKRGVIVCEEWRNDFKKFYDWAIEHGWEEGLQVDKDILSPTKPGKLYSPELCSVVTVKENQQNKSVNRMLTYNGETLCMEEWGRRVKKKPDTITARINKGWSVQDALYKPRVFGINQYTKMASA